MNGLFAVKHCQEARSRYVHVLH